MQINSAQAVFLIGLSLIGLSPVLAESYALVIGVNDCPQFRLPSGQRPRPLRGAESDADRFALMLIDRYSFNADQITVLKGNSATLGRVTDSFDQLVNKIESDDRFVLYFSGHGTQVADTKQLDEQVDRLDEALCLHDATVEGDGLMLDDDLGQWLDAIQARNVTVILDCCHSGTGIKGDDAVAKSLSIVTELNSQRSQDKPWVELDSAAKSIDRRMTVFCACQSEQQAYELRFRVADRFIRAGQFTHYLLESLQDRGVNGEDQSRPTQQEVFDYVSERIDTEFNHSRKGSIDRQLPILQSREPDLALFQ